MDVAWNIIGVIISFIFVFSIIGISEVLKKKNILSVEGSRKFVHVGVSNWWILAMYMIPNYIFALIPLLIFVVLNYMSYKKNIFSSMERGRGKEDLGTVYFPLSLAVLVLFTWWDGILFQNPYYGAVGALVMGYGDGFAAILGDRYGKHVYHIRRSKKSIEGSVAMFVFSFLVTIVILLLEFHTLHGLHFLVAFLVAIASTVIEGITPLGFDNITVPILSTFFYIWMRVSIL